ncbi:hypothetical protein [Lysobacter gummosus]|uniref:hypothetical protein n=1 Tax=Lysobacter gummosus TaxID=262324 RepID=UPI0036354086
MPQSRLINPIVSYSAARPGWPRCEISGLGAKFKCRTLPRRVGVIPPLCVRRRR